MTVYSNSPSSTVRSGLADLSRGVSAVRLAAPFFSSSEAIEALRAKDRTIYLIVRLGAATSPIALRKISSKSHGDVRIRFFTSKLFHSKLFLFGDKAALVGSANLTDAGLNSNREVAVTVGPDQDDFRRLVAIFENYWNDAHALDDDALEKYEELCKVTPSKTTSPLDESVLKVFGELAPSGGTQRGAGKLSSAATYLADYKRRYESFALAYGEVEELYVRDGRRKAAALPLRIEVDQFFNYIRKEHCHGRAYETAEMLGVDGRAEKLNAFLDLWFAADFPYIDVIGKREPIITSRLGTEAAIDKASMDELMEAIEVCHSFRDQKRFFPGALPTLEKNFKENTSLAQFRFVLKHLLHGSEPFIERLGSTIYEDRYALYRCGESVVQELLGWVNREGIPICNGRTRIVLRYLGHNLDVRDIQVEAD